jgi:alpha-1,3-mannosyltransferase
MLVLSKRLHSIFVLRLFNDCFAVLSLWAAIYFYQIRAPTLGSLAYSWGLGTKMSLLLSLPAFGVILFLTRGVQMGLKHAWQMVQVQIVISFPFIPANAVGYLGRAFEFSRVFLFKWTVNWRFVGEETFLSKEFSVALLAGHVSTLALFGLTRWLKPTGKSVGELVSKALKFEEPLAGVQHRVAKKVTAQFVLTTVLTANVIGMLFARSLHYQFYAYLAWSTPFLLWKSGMHPILQYALWAAQEWAWNVYPSTDLSSKVVVGVMAITVAAVWWGTGEEEEVPEQQTDEAKASSRQYIK